MSTDKERKRVSSQLRSYCVLLGESNSTYKDPYWQRHGVGPAQSWSGELADQGDRQTGEGGKKGLIQALEPGHRYILEQNPAHELVQSRAVLCTECERQQGASVGQQSCMLICEKSRHIAGLHIISL